MGMSSFNIVRANNLIAPQVMNTTGRVYFVNSGTGSIAQDAIGGSNGNDGLSPLTPFATIDFAIGQCAANRGDVIYAMPGHRELITAAITMDVAAVSVIGLGRNRPQLQYDGTGGIVNFTANDCYWANIRHTASIASITAAMNISAADRVTIDNCWFDFDATGIEFTLMIDADTNADYLTIQNCRFTAENINGAASAIKLDDCDGAIILNNYIQGDYNSVAIDGAADSSNLLDILVLGNVVENRDTGLAIDLDDSATGFVAQNVIFGGGALASNVDWGTCGSVENYVCDLADTSGVIIPTTASA